MGCPPVRRDNPRALASGLSYVQVDKYGITILYHLHHLHQCRPCISRGFSAKVGKGGVKVYDITYIIIVTQDFSFFFKKKSSIQF